MDAVLGWNLVLSLPVILAVAWLAGRLLGVSRSWAATLVAGAAGWLAALALSLAIAEGDTGAPGFTRNLWVFAAVFTMSASVWTELLAKPGALARAQRGARLPAGGPQRDRDRRPDRQRPDLCAGRPHRAVDGQDPRHGVAGRGQRPRDRADRRLRP
jgi:hypothetical protein